MTPDGVYCARAIGGQYANYSTSFYVRLRPQDARRGGEGMGHRRGEARKAVVGRSG